MSEGKLKEYIEKTFAIPKEGISKDDREVMAELFTIIKKSLLSILGEAKKDFPQPTTNDMLNTRNYLIWFKRWFGTQLNASMPQTVAGGCAGHIDLGKLQNIEKQEP